MKITSTFIQASFGFSRQQLYYWRKVGILSPSSRTQGDRGHFCYSFHDVIILKTIKTLREAGVSTFYIRKCFERIKQIFPNIENPLVENQILVFGKSMVYIHDNTAFDVMTGQVFLLDFKAVERWVGEIVELKKISQLTEKQASKPRERRVNEM
jgi:DNA-binding transcriptional MerR regulator